MKQGMSVREVAEGMGVSRRTVYKWLARHRQGSLAALRCSRPQPKPRRLAVERVATIAAMRRMGMSGPSIAFSLSMPLLTVDLEIRRLGLSRLPRLEPRAPIIRYEHENPGDMIHLEIKKLGRIDGVGHRITSDRSKPWPGRPGGCGSICMSAWTTTAEWPTANCCLMRRQSVPLARIKGGRQPYFDEHLTE